MSYQVPGSGVERRSADARLAARSVLIVEDNREMRRLIAEIVRKICDTVFECADGAESLAAFARHQPDWVLMDVEMPRMDGIAATAALKQSFPAARIIVLTKYNDRQTREAAREVQSWTNLLPGQIPVTRRIPRLDVEQY